MRTTIAILIRSTITLLPALFLFGANLASAAVITEVTASAVSYGSDHVGPAIPTTTSTPRSNSSPVGICQWERR